MSCQHWRQRFPRISVDEMVRDERRRYLSHLRDCRECRLEAARQDPTIVFSLLPTEDVSDAEIDEVRHRVHALRRVKELESLGRVRTKRRLAAGAIAATLLVAGVVIPLRRSPEGSEEIPFAGVVGVGSGLVQIPGAPASTVSGMLRVELRGGAEIDATPTTSVPERVWEVEIPVGDQGRVVRDLEGGYRLHFDLGDGVESESLQLRDFELLRTGDQGEISLLAADLEPELNRPMIVGLPSAGADPDPLWLELTWSKRTLASR